MEKTLFKQWSDASMLKSLPNPSEEGFEVIHTCPELTFLGADGKPDFAVLTIVFYPSKKVIELKSLKEYLYQFRTKIISYERLVNVIYDDLKMVFQPNRLRLLISTNVRGGISSTMKIDSDWACRGGKEVFSDWKREDGR